MNELTWQKMAQILDGKTENALEPTRKKMRPKGHTFTTEQKT